MNHQSIPMNHMVMQSPQVAPMAMNTQMMPLQQTHLPPQMMPPQGYPPQSNTQRGPPNNMPPYMQDQRNIPRDNYGPPGRYNNGGNGANLPFNRNNGGGKYLPPSPMQMGPMGNPQQQRMPMGIKKSINKDNNMRGGPGGYGPESYRGGMNGGDGQNPRRERPYRNFENDGYGNEFHGYQGGGGGGYPRGQNDLYKKGGRKHEVGQHKLSVTAFHKTKMCPAVENNVPCKKGEKCSYAHSKAELREPPNLKKTKLCQLFEMTRCNMGDKCDFAHGQEELKSYVDRFKTMICQAYAKTGNCPNGEKCHYAHGDIEIRQPYFDQRKQFLNDSIQATNAHQQQPQQSAPLTQQQPPSQQIQQQQHQYSQQSQSQQVQQQQLLQSQQQTLQQQQIQPILPQSAQQQQIQTLPQQQSQTYTQQVAQSYGYPEQTNVQYASSTQYPQHYAQSSTTGQQPLYTLPIPQSQVYTQSYAAQPVTTYNSQQLISYNQNPPQPYYV